MELSKLPRIAAALQLDSKKLCAKALAEFHPLVYAALFGPDAAPVSAREFSDHTPLRIRGHGAMIAWT